MSTQKPPAPPPVDRDRRRAPKSRPSTRKAASESEQIAAHGRAQANPYPKRQKATDAKRRRDAPSDLERKLWARLKHGPLGLTFVREHQIEGYVVDFYCAAARLIVEVDGAQHLDQVVRDKRRDEVLRANYYKVLRFPGHRIRDDLDRVVREIVVLIDTPAAHARQKHLSRPVDPFLEREALPLIDPEAPQRRAATAAANRKRVDELNKAEFECLTCGRRFVSSYVFTDPACHRCATSSNVRSVCPDCAKTNGSRDPGPCPSCLAQQIDVRRGRNGAADWGRGGKHTRGT